MNRKIYTALLTVGLVTGLVTPTFAAQTGLYVGSNYYSAAYLTTLTVSQRVTILNDTVANPNSAYAVINDKYALFKDYTNTGLASLIPDADSVVPAQVTDLSTGKLVDAKTGTEVVQGDLKVLTVSVTGAATVVNGQRLQMGVAVTPTNATNKNVTWSVEPLAGGTATIDATTGLLTAIGVGTVTVKAVATDGSSVQGTKVITIQEASIAAAVVNLGTASNYAILAKTGISSVPNSIITGNIGVSPIDSTAITGFSLTVDATNEFSASTQVIGKAYAPDYTSPTSSNLTTAVSDMETAYTDAAGRAANYTELGSGDISGQTLTAGVYKWGTGVSINKDVTLHGGANDVFIFQIAQGITQANGTKIILTGGAQAKNIFWQSSESVAIGTTAHFEGIILGKTKITLGTNASINGRLLAQTAVTLDASTVMAP